MLEHLEKSWDRCLCEAKREILDQRLAHWNGVGLYPELPSEEEALELARELYWRSQSSAAAKHDDHQTLY